MSAPAVKPVLPAPSAGSQGPSANTPSPLKNHTGTTLGVPISLVQDKTPEKSKDIITNAVPKPTPNGVEAPKAVSPSINEKKVEDTNHVSSPAPSVTAPTAPAATPVSNTASPKATPEKTPATNHTPTPAVNNTTSPKNATSTAVLPAPSSVSTINAQAGHTKTTSPPTASIEEKDKDKTVSAPDSSTGNLPRATPKRAAEKADKDKSKLATTPRGKRKRDTSAPSASEEDSSKSKRTRVPVQPYQSPMPEFFSPKPRAPAKSPELKNKEKDSDNEKLVIFYKNEFLAVRNSEGSFYVCQALQNVYKSSHKIKIRWLSEQEGDKDSSLDGTTYSPDFYDTTDFDCILTSLRLQRLDKSMFKLSKEESLRTENILQRALDVEKGLSEKPDITEEHPDGLDLSLFKDEAQLKKRKSQAKSTSSSPKRARSSEGSEKKVEKPKVEQKKAATPKRSPAKKGVSPRSGKRVIKAPAKTPVSEKKVKEEKHTASIKRAERASGRDKAKEKTPAKRKAESAAATPVRTPKTTPRAAAASAKKAAAAAAKAPTPATRKAPARGRKAESAEPEPSTSGRAAKTRNVRSSSPAAAGEKQETSETKKEVTESTASPADKPAPPSTPSTPSVASTDAVGASAPVTVSSSPSGTTPTSASDGVVSGSGALSEEGEASSPDAFRNRGGKKTSSSSPGNKKA